VGSSSPLIAVPQVNGRLHPLAAAYRVSLLPVVRERLAANCLRMTDLLAAVPTRVIEAEELADIDPDFRSLRNVNTPDEYAAALRELNPL
jgi:molybdenum cofactor guanylyltransferase